MSNQFNLKTYILFKCFNKEKNHHIKISLNSENIFEKSIVKNKMEIIKFNDYFDFKNSQICKLTIDWSGEESAEKYLLMQKVVINCQEIKPFAFYYYPYENEYIKKLRETKEFTKKLLANGFYYGWYGKISTKFLLGDKQEVVKLRIKDPFSINALRPYEINPNIEAQVSCWKVTEKS